MFETLLFFIAGFLAIIWAANALVAGRLCACVAAQNGRNDFYWFTMGFVFGIPALLLIDKLVKE